jgi:Amt family ammonium transporter
MVAADIAWVLVASALVWFMVPGLALFYGGFTSAKSMVNTLAMVLIAIAIGGVAWFVVGYSLAFSGNGNWVGNFDLSFLYNVSMTTSTRGLHVPDGAFALFQGMFPMITMAIIAGAVVGRMNFKAFLLFLTVWMILVYAPLAHMVWGGGFLAEMGALDFAGGDVVHISSGVSALVLSLVVGKRRDMTRLRPQHLLTVVLGGAFLWFGWFGFNAGSALAADGVAVLAFINTNIAAATGMIVWVLIDLYRDDQMHVAGAFSGALSGLVGITPAAGYVEPGAAAAIGVIATLVVYVATTRLKRVLGYDDTLDAFGIHGVGGVVGGVLTGVFANKALAGQAGLLAGNWQLLGVQLLGILVTVVFSAGLTYLIAKAVGLVLPLRVDATAETIGIDAVLHGETAR